MRAGAGAAGSKPRSLSCPLAPIPRDVAQPPAARCQAQAKSTREAGDIEALQARDYSKASGACPPPRSPRACACPPPCLALASPLMPPPPAPNTHTPSSLPLPLRAQVKDASLLRFLVDMRDADLEAKQMRDDLMTMLIAGEWRRAAALRLCVWHVGGWLAGWLGASPGIYWPRRLGRRLPCAATRPAASLAQATRRRRLSAPGRCSAWCRMSGWRARCWRRLMRRWGTVCLVSGRRLGAGAWLGGGAGAVPARVWRQGHTQRRRGDWPLPPLLPGPAGMLTSLLPPLSLPTRAAWDDFANLPYTRMTIAEAMRLYPQPPILIRRQAGAGGWVRVCVICVGKGGRRAGVWAGGWGWGWAG